MDTTRGAGTQRAERIALDRPVLIVGAPRSGTTWLHRLLLADERICGGQESHFFASFGGVIGDFDRKLAMDRPHGLGCAWKRDDLLREIRSLWVRTMKPAIDARESATTLVEKTPDHALHLEAIAEVVPEARIIHLVRDSRAVAASLLAAHRDGWGREWSTGDPAVAAEVWNRFVGAAQSASGALAADSFMKLHFEHLRSDPVGALVGVMSFIGIETDRERLDRAVRTVEAATAERPGESGYALAGELAGRTVSEPKGFVRTGSVAGWRSELGGRGSRTVWRRTRPLMEALGYHRDGSLDGAIGHD